MYDRIARFYDLSHADLTDDVDYVVALAKKAGARVLELGCGSGRLLLPLARAGVAVVGVDNAPAMLARAERRLAAEPAAVQARVELVEADMTALDLGENGRFDLIILPYNTAMHLDSAGALAALRVARRLAATEGKLLIDVINPSAVASTPDDQSLVLEAVLSDPETDEIVVQLSSSHLDDEHQTLHITWIYDASPAAGGPVSRTVVQGAYHYRYPHQWELLLREAGWRLSALTGDYDGSVFGEESERLLLTAVAGNP